MIKLDISENPVKNIYLGIGSNLGNRITNIERAKAYLLENNINAKKDVLIYVDSKKIDILKNLKKRKNLNIKILNKFKEIQLPLDYKKNSSHFIIKNKFTKKSVNIGIQKILKKLENERNSS